MKTIDQKNILLASFLFLFITMSSCFSGDSNIKSKQPDTAISCETNLPQRFAPASDTLFIKNGTSSTEGMVMIPGGGFLMGAADDEGRPDEYKPHKVTLDSFWMDATEVTNAQFGKFVDATGYVTTAEKKPDWEEIKKQLPPGTPRPDESLLVASSLVFTPPGHAISLTNIAQWWKFHFL